ncbi:MAG TPA: hypothetical protein VEL11_09815 [Candidatus Bathyarchaeia archaeon]|nr:hypothetical protein [Candidatus Bathyarchaeia archaeon]
MDKETEQMLSLYKWTKLDIRHKELWYDLNATYETSAVGQAPDCYLDLVEKLYKIQSEKAKIWNQIRGNVVPGTQDSLWTLALRSDDDRTANKEPCIFMVNIWGEETCVSFFADNVKALWDGGL